MKKILLSLIGILCSMSMWADDAISCSAYPTETAGTVTATNCVLKYFASEGSNASNVPVINAKVNGDANFFELTLNQTVNGTTYKTFKAGDVITVYLYGKKESCKIGKTAKTVVTAPTSSSEAAVQKNYTLTAADIEANGTIRIYRNSSNTHFAGVSVTGTRKPLTPSDFTLTSQSNVFIGIGSTSQITTTSSSDAAITYQSSNTNVATVSATGLITAVSGGQTSIAVKQAENSTYDEGGQTVNVYIPFAATPGAQTYKFTNSTFGFSYNNNWYFNNGWSISTDQGFQYAALECDGKANNGFKVSAGKTYTINVPVGVTIRSAKVTMRNNYKSTDKDVKAANWGTIFGQDLSSETLPYSNETADTKEFDITNETPMTFTPGGNQCQMYIELSTEALKQNNDLALSSNTANVDKDRTATVTFTSSSTGNVTATSNNTSVATVTVNGNNIEITGVTAGTATVTVAQVADATYKAGEQAITVTVTDPTAPIVLFDALNKVGSTEAVGTATVASSGMFTFGNGIDPNSTGAPVNYVKIVPANGSFKAGDVIDFTAYINNNNKEKVGYLAIVAPNDQETTVLFTSEQLKNINKDGSNYASEAVPQSYTLTEDYESLYIARAASGNTNTYVYGLTVSRAATASINTTVVGEATKAYATFCGSRNFTATAGTIYKAAVNGEVVALTCVNPTGDEIIPASEGVIIATNGSSSVNVTYPVAASATANMDGNELQGTTTRIATPDNCMALNATAGEFQSYTGAYFPANKAYLVNAAGAKNMRVVFGNTTGIKAVNTEATVNKAVKRIMNGQLVIEKAGKMYNAAGAEIK